MLCAMCIRVMVLGDLSPAFNWDTHTHTHKHTHAHTHTYTHKHAHTHAHIHTHIHTHATQVAVVVALEREQEGTEQPATHAPRFPGRKDEGWWLVVGDAKANALLAIKRVNLGKAAKVRTWGVSEGVGVCVWVGNGWGMAP
jgi:ABC-type Zn2+ transport system substrate-binding protein/surface adhesin